MAGGPDGDAGVSLVRLLLLTGIGLITGVVNTVAGGGSLLSFPALLALGYSPLIANVTNTVGVFPSSVGGLAALPRRQWPPLLAVLAISVYGGYFGVAAVAFVLLGPVVWSVALVLGGSTVLGGMLGAVVARRLSDRVLRLAVVLTGLGAAVYSAIR
jgi:uncharacterized membrane protein YfcA